MDCLFCKIVNGELPCYKIYENDKVLAFLDISLEPEGHTLVIPKKHSTNTLDILEDDLIEVIKAVKLISNHYVNDCGYDGVDIVNANNKCAEQSVFHTHYHIIPRKNNDGEKFFSKFSKSLDDLEKTANKLKIN